MQIVELRVLDIGDYKDVQVIEILIAVGDMVAADEPLVTLESDKATMDVPSTATGRITEILVKTGDRVAQGSLIARLEVADFKPPFSEPRAADLMPRENSMHDVVNCENQPVHPAVNNLATAITLPSTHIDRDESNPELAAGGLVSNGPCGPSVRRLARQLGVNLAWVIGSGAKGRIRQEDVIAHVKRTMHATQSESHPTIAHGSLDLVPWPKISFEKFGPIERRSRSRIQKLSAGNLHRNWVMVPHVTNFDEANITELESFRTGLNGERGIDAAKVTILAFLIKAAVHTLQAYPAFNCSLEGDEIVEKRYWHIGFASDTQNGLVVPVIRDADRKGVLQIAAEVSELAQQAREGKLTSEQIQGGCFTISSLGGIGGTGFTPIINAPEVAILGVTRATLKPIWNGKRFVPRLILPLCLSWDHRAIDGAAAASFLVHLTKLLADFRRITL